MKIDLFLSYFCELKEMDEPIIEEDGVDKPRADVERMDE